jgi:hypothetical protein
LIQPGVFIYAGVVKTDWYNFLLDILSALMVSGGTSAACGPFYQGYINVGGDEPFVNENEKREMEFANPITGKTVWIKRFWYGRRRVYLAFLGVVEVVVGLFIIFG